MKHIPIPDNFTGLKYKQIYGEPAISELEGKLAVPDDFEGDLSDCVLSQDELNSVVVDRLWKIADERAFKIADHNSRAKYLWWIIDPNVSPEAKVLISQVNHVMDSIWQGYGLAKAHVGFMTEDELIALIPDPTAPSFQEIASAL